MKLFFNDVETTGLSTEKHDIIQIGGLISNKFKILEEINFKCQPSRWDTINAMALSVNNTTKEQLKTYELPEQTWKKYSQLLLKHFNGEKYVFVAQNAPFDRRFIRQWWNTYKTKDVKDFDYYFQPDNLDLMDITRQLKKYGFLKIENLKLETVIKAFGIIVEGDLHDALVDIKATGNSIYRSLQLVSKIKQQDPNNVVVKKFNKWIPLLG